MLTFPVKKTIVMSKNRSKSSSELLHIIVNEDEGVVVTLSVQTLKAILDLVPNLEAGRVVTSEEASKLFGINEVDNG